ncbi:uncharacterized protein TRAVEDRAFT_168919 [Trametes versicolor FP-101664 SS1]|uniref:uncharacterized protein n=1 Tax=Trametes versicolor (strain FP-101664) TaxID=717944 RepID=UPI0004621424|nr:uncharacterized protein TRAVEDRAFT_168919 [Trametes versicolor FP-101664 SS1]EIW57273.1 hypothetical protein TRAVEDRAFT_168919 [Trametes versicolor FP-101664 SS1]
MANDPSSLIFVYYCSGHGYGHATRVSAFASHLLRLEPRPTIHIVSSAPKHVFSDSVALGALYRNANIDPVIVQPLAYRVDRQKSVKVLQKFLTEKEYKVAEESQWLRSIKADCVLSDAAFLGCLAANDAGIPSVLITNFSFDSVYSYLSTPFIDEVPEPDVTLDALQPHVKPQPKLEPDVPIPLAELAPLVKQIHDGYRCADLLLRLPGTIPLPSFAVQPGLPSQDWIDIKSRAFKPFVVKHLTQSPSTYELQPQIPFPPSYQPKPLPREVRNAPLLVRSTDPEVYTPEGRSRLLTSIGVPPHLHDPEQTKILIVSFGGQVFHKPHSRSHSRTPSKSATPNGVLPGFQRSPDGSMHPADHPPPLADTQDAVVDSGQYAQALSDALKNAALNRPDPSSNAVQEQNPLRALPAHLTLDPDHVHTRPRGHSQLRLAGAPPAAVPAPTSPRISSQMPAFVTIPPTPLLLNGSDSPDYSWGIAGAGPPGVDATALEAEAEPRILPDASWIAIVCGVSKDWGREDGEELPENFFVAPRDVYMPDLTAVADVLLGKLGYGTVSECVDACTPFVYVPRPLFIEEHGLRLFLSSAGVGRELARTQYEQGEWADAVDAAWRAGRAKKAAKRRAGETGTRRKEGAEMARGVVEWVARWKEGVARGPGVGVNAGRVRSSDGMGALC